MPPLPPVKVRSVVIEGKVEIREGEPSPPFPPACPTLVAPSAGQNGGNGGVGGSGKIVVMWVG